MGGCSHHLECVGFVFTAVRADNLVEPLTRTQRDWTECLRAGLPDTSGHQRRGGVRTTADSRGKPFPIAQPGQLGTQQRFTKPLWTLTSEILCKSIATHPYGLFRQRDAYILAQASNPRRSVLMAGWRNKSSVWMPWVRAAAPTTQRQASADPRQQKPEEPGGCGDPGWQAGSGAALSAAAQAAVVTWARGVGQGRSPP